MVLLSQAPFSPLSPQYFKVPCDSLLWPSGWKARTLFTLLCNRVPATVPKFRSKLKLVPTLQKVLSVVIYCYQENRQTKKSRGFCNLFGTTDPLVRISLEFLVPVGSCCHGYHCPPRLSLELESFFLRSFCLRQCVHLVFGLPGNQAVGY